MAIDAVSQNGMNRNNDGEYWFEGGRYGPIAIIIRGSVVDPLSISAAFACGAQQRVTDSISKYAHIDTPFLSGIVS